MTQSYAVAMVNRFLTDAFKKKKRSSELDLNVSPRNLYILFMFWDSKLTME